MDWGGGKTRSGMKAYPFSSKGAWEVPAKYGLKKIGTYITIQHRSATHVCMSLQGR